MPQDIYTVVPVIGVYVDDMSQNSISQFLMNPLIPAGGQAKYLSTLLATPLEWAKSESWTTVRCLVSSTLLI